MVTQSCSMRDYNSRHRRCSMFWLPIGHALTIYCRAHVVCWASLVTLRYNNNGASCTDLKTDLLQWAASSLWISCNVQLKYLATQLYLWWQKVKLAKATLTVMPACCVLCCIRKLSSLLVCLTWKQWMVCCSSAVVGSAVECGCATEHSDLQSHAPLAITETSGHRKFSTWSIAFSHVFGMSAGLAM